MAGVLSTVSDSLRQERMGLDGKPFMMLNFRSMRIDAESTTGPVWAVHDDFKIIWMTMRSGLWHKAY